MNNNTTDYRGIDYSGHSGVNRDKASGIRYGVISQNEVLQAWADSSDPYYGKPDEYECPKYSYESNGYAAECGENGDIFVIKSPYFTYAQFCSPCAPGACYLMNPLSEPYDDNRAYCFGHDWFESGVAPYPVYSVETGERVEAAAN